MTRNDGPTFGLAPDPTSQAMYRTLMPALLNGTDLDGPCVDLGGGNGLLRRFIPDAITVDLNPTMDPDIIADVLDWVPVVRPDFAVTRYTAHYWDDATLDRFLRHVATYTDRLLSIQIATVDREAKEAISSQVGEPAWWRDRYELADAYLDSGWHIHSSNAAHYSVVPEFYTHRLGFTPETAHDETVVLHDLRKA